VCNDACIAFGRTYLSPRDVSARKVLEVGSLNVNGSLRRTVEDLGPSSYLGVDLVAGPGVDDVCDVLSLRDRFGDESFDVVISTEALEHIREWRGAISNMKRVLRPGGILLLTTRSRGFPYHGYPHDFWRFEPSDMEAIFGDFLIEIIQTDSWAPGVFVKCRKPQPFAEKNLADHQLYSVVTKRRCRDIGGLDLAGMKLGRALRRCVAAMLPPAMKDYARKRISALSEIWRR
jgi:SAM-dependent methyltransferase